MIPISKKKERERARRRKRGSTQYRETDVDSAKNRGKATCNQEKIKSFLKVCSLLNYKTSQHEQMLIRQHFDRKSGEYLIIARFASSLGKKYICTFKQSKLTLLKIPGVGSCLKTNFRPDLDCIYYLFSQAMTLHSVKLHGP